jgi:hypothetical protein
VTKAKYSGARHRGTRAKLKPTVDAGQAMCAETLCLEQRDGRTRWIAPGTPWDLAETDDGLEFKGPAHRRCNRADGARRGNQMRGKRGVSVRRRVL